MTASTDNAPGRIFMSYRRDDAAYPAGWLYDRLTSYFGRNQIFRDIDSIELGDDFVQVITAAVGSCDVLLAVIGARWLTITDQDGRRRLDNPGDFVRVEIEAALARTVRVIPILVDGARMPHAHELPASLSNLAHRQALDLSPHRFDSDMGRLLRMLDRTIARQRRVERLQEQICERAAAQDWDAVVAASDELAALDPAAADPDGLASAARERKTREEADQKTREEAERKAREDAQRKAREEARRKVREEADRKAREEAQRPQDPKEQKAPDPSEQPETLLTLPARKRIRRKVYKGLFTVTAAGINFQEGGYGRYSDMVPTARLKNATIKAKGMGLDVTVVLVSGQKYEISFNSVLDRVKAEAAIELLFHAEARQLQSSSAS